MKGKIQYWKSKIIYNGIRRSVLPWNWNCGNTKDIGDFFLGNNIFEYKSPGDDVNAGTFYKALSYACLYKAEAGSVEKILNTDITVSLVREQKPVKLLGIVGK